MLKLFKKYNCKDDGNILIMTSIFLPIGLFVLAVAVDVSMAYHRKQQIQAAADNAVLVGASEANIAYASLETIDFEEEIEAAAIAAFEAAMWNTSGVEIVNTDVSANIIENRITAKINIEAKYSTNFLGTFDYPDLEINVESEAEIASATYAEFNFLFDVSASMGIGSTKEDRELVKTVTKNNCAFTCHVGDNTSYVDARAVGAEMRIDTARIIASDALRILDENMTIDDQFIVGGHIFDNVVETFLESDHFRASDMDYASSEFNDNVFMQELGGGTNIEKAIADISENIPVSGSGQSPDSRKQYMLIMTDGVESSQALEQNGSSFRFVFHEDAELNSPYKQYRSHEANYAMNTDVCENLRDKGVEIYFIYAEYIRPEDQVEERFDFIEDTLLDLSRERFIECTGNEENVLPVRTPEEIDSALRKVLYELTTPLHRK